MNYAIVPQLPGLPNFRRYLYFNAYQEGWGAQCRGAGEVKWVRTWMSILTSAARATEIWRAIRLGIDTGLHSLRMGPSIYRSGYFSENSAEGQIRAEVQRYTVMPGQTGWAATA